MNRLFVVLILVLGLVVVGILSPAPALATDKYFCGETDSTWNDDGNWEEYDPGAGGNCANGTASTVPTAADRAIIVSGKTCNVDITTAVADSLNVESTATLNIQAAKKLSLDSSTASTTITGTGRVYLQASGSELAFIDNSQTIDGTGKIVGQDNGAKISIENTTTLTSDTIIEGQLKITGLGDFVNTGIVHANVAGTLLIDCNSIEDADDAAVVEWQISTSPNAIMRIDPASGTAPVLDGDFTVSGDGTLDVDSPGFTTSGRLTFDLGTIDASGLSGSEVAKFTG